MSENFITVHESALPLVAEIERLRAVIRQCRNFKLSYNYESEYEWPYDPQRDARNAARQVIWDRETERLCMGDQP